MASEKINYDSTPEDQARAKADLDLRNNDTVQRAKAILAANPHAEINSWVVGGWGKKDENGKHLNDRDTVKIVNKIPSAASQIIQPLEIPTLRRQNVRPLKRDHNIIYVVSDAQIGYRNVGHGEDMLTIHDEDAIFAATMLARYLKPDMVIDLGDTTDLAEISRWPKDSNHFQGTLQPSMRRTQKFYTDLRDNTPHAKRRIVMDSNHAERWDKHFLQNTPELYNLKMSDEAEYSELSYQGVLGLDKIGWDFKGGYGEATFRYNGAESNFEQREDEDNYAREDLAFFHGVHGDGRGGTATWLTNHKDNQDRNVVQGHTHKAEMQSHRDRRGKLLRAYVCGTLCNLDGRVPSFHSAIDSKNRPYRYAENWTNGVMVIRDYGDGEYEFQQVDIENGILHLNGETVSGKELSQEKVE